MRGYLILLFLFLTVFTYGQTLTEIDSLVGIEMNAQKLPGLAVAVINSGKIVHLSAYGYRDWNNKDKANINTSFQIASVSKIVTSLAIFKLVESKKIDLDSDINIYLPFEVKNPHFPNDKITVRELLNHSSGIKDDDEIIETFLNKPNGDSKIILGDFIRDYLNINGKLYKREHFESDSSYKSFAYSNTGYALLGLIVENVSQTNFEEFCQKNIFKPLGMINTSWFLSGLDTFYVAKPYIHNDSTGFEFIGHNGYPYYPTGQLRTSISDFSLLLTGYLNSDNSQFILSPKTTNEITPIPQISHNGFFTWFLHPMNNKIYYGHGGGDRGVSTAVVIDVKNKNGIILFANTDIALGHLLREIEKQMFNK